MVILFSGLSKKKLSKLQNQCIIMNCSSEG
jgi:hypothetical protein